MNVGDVVYLKNDPHKMVVKTINPDGTVIVYTHDPNGFQIERQYPAVCLQATDPTAPTATT